MTANVPGGPASRPISTWVTTLLDALASDQDLARSFARTPGKVARAVGVPADAVADVLADIGRTQVGADVSLNPDLSSGTAAEIVAEIIAKEAALEGAANLSKIDRIVVVMQENRSFDHMLGYLSLPPSIGGRGRSDVDGLDLERDTNPAVDGEPVGLVRLTDGVFLDNPGHTAGRVDGQIANGAMNGFVRDFANVIGFARAEHPDWPHEEPGAIMGYHTAATVPVYDMLAEEYTVCDRWHSPMPGPTWPNRMYFYAGMCGSGDAASKNAGKIGNYSSYAPKMPTDLVVHRLQSAGASWGVYRGSVIPWLAFFPSFRAIDHWKRRVKPYRNFDRDCRQGDLPQVTFIDPHSNLAAERSRRFNDDQAPSDVARGQELVGEVYETLRVHGLLASTLLVVLYDEHGGFYDHRPPPDVPGFARTRNDAFTTYGVRVPALVVSAFVEPGSVFHEFVDHAAVLHSILLRFCGGAPMGPRVAVARNLGQLLTRATPRPALPSAAGAIDAARAIRSSRLGTPDVTTAVDASLLAMLRG